MNRRLRWCAFAAALMLGPTFAGLPTSSAAEQTGSFAGTVKYNGAAPKRGAPAGFNPADPKTDKYCVKNAKLILDESLIVDRKSKGIANAVVYLLGKPPAGYKPKPVPKKPLRFTNSKCAFVPHILVARVGQTIQLANDDPKGHNVHTYPLSPENTAFNQLLPAKGEADLVYRDREPLPVKVGCDIHRWMVAYHVVFNHDLVAVTDKNGKFQIDGLPPGTYTFRIWHEKPGYLEKKLSVTIAAGKTTRKTFSYKPAVFAGP